MGSHVYVITLNMNKINALVTRANGNLDSKVEIIKKAVREAEQYVFPKLMIDWDIDLLVSNRLYDVIIPEDGVGGRTRASDFIEFAIDERKATESLISEILVHELCHAARWGKNDEEINSLFDGMISEGIATYLEAEFVKDRTEKLCSLKLFWNEVMRKMKKFLKNFVASWIQIIMIMAQSSSMKAMNFPAGPVIH